MDCKKFSEMLDNYENLNENERESLRLHSESCADCKKELDFFMSMCDTLHTLPKIDVPSDFLDKLNARIDAEEENTARRTKFVNHLGMYGGRYSAAAAALILAVVVGVNGKPLLEALNGGDDGVISETVTTAKPSENTETAVSEKKDENNGNIGENNGETKTDAVAETDREKTSGNPVKEKTESTESKTEQAAEPTAMYVSTAAPQNQTAAQTDATAVPVSPKSENVDAVTENDTDISADETPNTEDVSDDIPDDEGYSVSGNSIDTYAYTDTQDTDISTKNESTAINLDDYYVVLDGMITVDSDSYDDAITVIAKYVTGLYNGCYITSADQFNMMIDELYSKDISFGSSVMPMSDMVSFKVIVVN